MQRCTPEEQPGWGDLYPQAAACCHQTFESMVRKIIFRPDLCLSMSL